MYCAFAEHLHRDANMVCRRKPSAVFPAALSAKRFIALNIQHNVEVHIGDGFGDAVIPLSSCLISSSGLTAVDVISEKMISLSIYHHHFVEEAVATVLS